MTLPELIAFREKLVGLRLSGVREFQDQNGERVRYGSDREMLAAIAAAEKAIAEFQVGRPPHTIVFATSKGV